jgi:hypothetical protein
MILLITPSARGQECAQALHSSTSEPTQVASSLRQASTCLRAHDFSAVVIHQSALDLEPDESASFLQNMGAAVPVYVSFAVNRMERVVQELRLALQRRKQENQISRQVAERELRSELKGTATAILVSCEMALASPELPAGAHHRIQAVHQLAQEMCRQAGHRGLALSPSQTPPFLPSCPVFPDCAILCYPSIFADKFSRLTGRSASTMGQLRTRISPFSRLPV